MIGEKDVKILCRLRKNGRMNLTKMSRETEIPVSTIHDRIRKYSSGVIDKHTVLLNFRSLGYDLRVNMLLKVPSESRNDFEKFVRVCENVNSLYRINNGYDFMVDAVFRDMTSFKKFTDTLLELGIENIQEYFILEDLKREGFLTDELLHRAS